MKTEEIANGSAEIAKFMGIQLNCCMGRKDMVEIKGKMIPVGDATQYHSSWDWLMPVILKIGNDTGWTLVMEENTSYWCNEGQHPDFHEFGGYGNILNIYEAVVEFLNWNKNQ